MDDGSGPLWVVVLIFFCFAAYFAVAETSFASVSRVRIKTAGERGEKHAQKALQVLDEFDRAVTTILIGTNITHLGISSIVTVIVIRNWGAGFVTVSTLVTTLALFFLSEMLPKSIAKRYCEPLSKATAGSILLFMKVFGPFSRALTAIGQTAAGKMGQEDEVSVTEDELHSIIEGMASEGMLEEDQGELITSALDFGDITAEKIFTPAANVEGISVDMSTEEVKSFLLSHHHSRYPVYEKDTGHVIGTLQMRKFLRQALKEETPDLRALIDPPYFVHLNTDVSDLLHEMNENKVSLAFVMDSQEKICGILTIEDVVEELVGETGGDPA